MDYVNHLAHVDHVHDVEHVDHEDHMDRVDHMDNVYHMDHVDHVDNVDHEGPVGLVNNGDYVTSHNRSFLSAHDGQDRLGMEQWTVFLFSYCLLTNL